MEVLFHFLAERYEKKSVVINLQPGLLPVDQIFKDPMTTMAAVDRLVHHATSSSSPEKVVRAGAAKLRQK